MQLTSAPCCSPCTKHSHVSFVPAPRAGAGLTPSTSPCSAATAATGPGRQQCCAQAKHHTHECGGQTGTPCRGHTPVHELLDNPLGRISAHTSSLRNHMARMPGTFVSWQQQKAPCARHTRASLHASLRHARYSSAAAPKARCAETLGSMTRCTHDTMKESHNPCGTCSAPSQCCMFPRCPHVQDDKPLPTLRTQWTQEGPIRWKGKIAWMKRESYCKNTKMTSD